MGNAVPKLGDVFGKKSAVIAFEDALNDSFRQQQLLASEVEKLNQKVAMLQEQTSQYEAYGREQQTAADDARRELRRLKDFVAEQQALGSFVTDPDTDEALNGEGEGLVEQLRSELRSTKQKLELAEHALLTPEVLSARRLRSTKLQDMEDTFRGAKAGNPVPGRLTPMSVMPRRKQQQQQQPETEERKRARLKRARETPLKEFKPWEGIAAAEANTRGPGDAWQR